MKGRNIFLVSILILLIVSLFSLSKKAERKIEFLEDVVNESKINNSTILEINKSHFFSSQVVVEYKLPPQKSIKDTYNHYCSFFKGREGWRESKRNESRDYLTGCSEEKVGKRIYSAYFCNGKKAAFLLLIKGSDNNSHPKISMIKIAAMWRIDNHTYCS